ncbi:MAG TPA: Cof-type HAD-IIB family hydrolase [Chthoniobacterales bacterium]|nr:Cof-type HAD-IIB family hydrolase [Chthoniobacterales bacterium]
MMNQPRPSKSAVRLFAIDVDGTLLDSSHRLKTVVRDAVCRLAASGVQVALATARGPQAVRDIVRQFDFSPWLIGFSGAWIGELDAGSLQVKNVRSDERIPAARARSILSTAISHELEPNVFTPESWRIRTMTQEILDECAIVNLRPIETTELMTTEEEPSKIMLISRLDQVAALKEIEESVRVHAAATFSKSNYLEILPAGVNKAKALITLVSVLRVDLADVAAIGDAPNDLEMLNAVGFAIAMGNASDRVKSVADLVVGTNDNAGVAEAVDKILNRSRRD